MVQRKIKALADEVNATEALKAQTAPEPSFGGPMEDSIAALKTTADRMRARKAAQSSPPSRVPEYGDVPAAANYQASRETRTPAPHSAYVPEPAAQNTPATAQPAGSLPSLDALIPATAQPIAVSHAGAPRAPQAAAPPAPVAAPASAPTPTQSAFIPEATSPALQAAARVPAPAPSPRSTSVDRRLAEIAQAIESSRMDVYLNPIVGLGDYAVTHFEVSVRLKSSTGAYIDNPEQTLSLGAGDLLALFDIERLNRTALVAAQLEARGKQGSLLSPTAGQSMTDGQFLEAFARTFEDRTSISGQLVLTFTQADISAFGPGTWQALADMHSFGFRFALDQVTHLGTDFMALAEKGFAFVKLPVVAFLDGLPAGHGMVPPADICRHMAGAGLTLVVDDDAILARVFGFGALFGQGRLFGGSRQITLEGLGAPQTAAA
jgi:cyclic-di-GMP phosphodiesterase TipF (flagellum assembly factor)